MTTGDTASTTFMGSGSAPASRQFPSETSFRKALDWERQRSERSGRSLLLALLDLNAPHWKGVSGEPREAALPSIAQVIRSTDTVGWYRNGTMPGVMFTELRDSDESNAKNTIDARLRKMLGAVFPPPFAQDVRITYHVFPKGDTEPGMSDSIFYPEGESEARRGDRIAKRCLDLAGGLLALVLLSPLLVLISMAVKLTSRGPILCKQERIGKGGRTFTLLKFRTMFHNNDPTVHQEYVKRMIAGQDVVQDHTSAAKIYKIVNDPRVTPVGRFLRRSSLDEAPQFLNVLLGDMSLVGPRPPLPYELSCYRDWHRRRVLEVNPGITGLWQILGRSRTTFDEMVRLDLQYARHWSLWLDLKILLKTPGAVFSGSGAY